MSSRITSATVELPWPAEALHPNARPNRYEKARSIKKARADAYAMAKGIGKLDAEAVKVTCVFFPPPVKRDRDLDNLVAACKAYFDGIAEAIGVNDRKFLPQAPAWGLPVKGGNVRIMLEAVDTWEHGSGPAARVIAAIPVKRRDVA